MAAKWSRIVEWDDESGKHKVHCFTLRELEEAQQQVQTAGTSAKVKRCHNGNNGNSKGKRAPRGRQCQRHPFYRGVGAHS